MLLTIFSLPLTKKDLVNDPSMIKRRGGRARFGGPQHRAPAQTSDSTWKHVEQVRKTGQKQFRRENSVTCDSATPPGVRLRQPPGFQIILFPDEEINGILLFSSPQMTSQTAPHRGGTQEASYMLRLFLKRCGLHKIERRLQTVRTFLIR